MGAPDRTTDAPPAGADPVRDDQFAGELGRPQRCYVCEDHYRRIHHFYHRLGPDCARDNLVRRRARNAAQTLRRSPRAYSALAAAEAAPARTALPAAKAPAVWTAPGFGVPGAVNTGVAGRSWAAGLVPRNTGTPESDGSVLATVDEAGLLTETAAENSWTARLGGIDPAELLEVQLVNAVAPFLLADRLPPLLESSPHARRYLLNVTAVEGQFAVHRKTSGHPHTNMAKAALNMLTRTSAGELAERGIHVCSVDTGWVTDEKPLPARERHAATGWRPPLDIVDGAARIYHPIVQGQAGSPVHGVLTAQGLPARRLVGAQPFRSASSWSRNHRCGGSAVAAAARRFVRAVRSSSSIVRASCRAAAVADTSYGLTTSASSPSSS
ncbi:tropinone reductase [Streptomyces sp. S4.7]|nr:tropinone reductase [Streptomyces sp. S4.7]